MKAHIGADAQAGLVRSVCVTSANESDIGSTHAVLHGQEQRVRADSGYTGVAEREEIVQAQTEGRIRKDIVWHVAAKRGKIVALVAPNRRCSAIP
jgi:IS5 family transposase